MQTKVKKFSDLTLWEYHQLMKTRIAVFVVEQACAYQEIDDIDLEAIHFWLENDEKEIIAYSRIYQDEQAVHFGRVLVKEEARKNGLGRQLVQQTIEWIEQEFPEKMLHIAAEAYLQNFYASFGFQTVSDEYLMDGLYHIDMEK
ncbi:GNAT family N-acetyltransferase [Tetragenococcus koreensis]|uniref:GNAT family N-acetyltransferase n=1 Tax=Tetragenococcus koreensis TaxID=290335 RepID=UPI001F2A1464|nr:GNAT family N-acetyltransferase [Tetragenococcus koreensis]MCF1584686.1 GNAT family N-acetyltransferase [Tetragenococcus koreensis]MCF1614284.1 GNAT family N-acetyltransferase [Tetragenococcus koreensis]MCF1616490.1 GNAT family N-acetyltransferase [Tetragenococcus koreensis]MCF1621422.1 GNAT family N-acetyltransferase [Tetragenococcus koreensis]MCF1624080.1 GNAT family N-acetyltransferase [Tetragenococcus koreensis]